MEVLTKAKLEKLFFFHDSIVSSISIENSTFLNDENSLVFQRNGWNRVYLELSSQKGYCIKLIFSEVKKMNLTQFYDLIIFRCAIKEDNGRQFFSLTGGFEEGAIFFDAKKIEYEKLKK